MATARSAAELSNDSAYHRHAFDEIQRRFFGAYYSEVPVKLELSVDPDPRLMGQRWSLYAITEERYRWWKQKQIRVKPRVVALQRFLGDREISMSRRPALLLIDDFLKRLVEDALRGFAPRLYEADHRIGAVHSVGWSENQLMACPIFDPPGGIRLPDPRRGSRWDHCYCRTKLMSGERATWGGGNLLWVCEHCSGQWSPVIMLCE